MRKFILFDLDGTLVDVFDEHISSFIKMEKEIFGVDLAPEDIIKNIGHPARVVISDPLIERGVDPKVIGEKMETAYQSYKKHLGGALERIGEDVVLPGVLQVLEVLSQRGELLGLITGNISTVGMLILERTGLARYFKIHSFGDVAIKRSDMVERAVGLAGERYGFAPNKDNVFIVGDSVHDIKAGKESGCKTIAVATGFASENDLKGEKPDFLFRSMEDTEGFLKAFEDQI
jgi:phosphoglycolate phosphatase